MSLSRRHEGLQEGTAHAAKQGRDGQRLPAEFANAGF
jgi:hypothetical protein